MAAAATSAADGVPRRRAMRRISGRPIIVVMVVVWLIVLALTVVMVVRFKMGGIDAIRSTPRGEGAGGISEKPAK